MNYTSSQEQVGHRSSTERRTQTEDKPFSQLSPQEAHDRIKNTVSKALATAAGAVEGVADSMREHEIPRLAQEAVAQVGSAIRKIGTALRDEVKISKDTLIGHAGDQTDNPGPDKRHGDTEDAMTGWDTERPEPREEKTKRV